ncbi:MAG: hypothetical protein IVW57_02785 [Ktedonobacterales bacterium]|nr:hypothetical protein [Ktedonobacterales bacterium]
MRQSLPAANMPGGDLPIERITDVPVPVGVSSTALAGAAFAAVRIATGFLWYQAIFFKLPGHTTGFHTELLAVARYAWMPGYGALVRALLVPSPNDIIFSYLIFFLEGLIAISLLFGVLARLGALVGMLWAAQLFIGLAYSPDTWAWSYGMLVMLNALLALLAAGRSFGVDRWLRPRMLRAAEHGHQLAYWIARAE